MHKYARKILNYAAGNFFNKILLFLFLPIFTSYLVPKEYAVYANLMVFFNFIGMIYFLGLQQSLYSYFYKEKSDRYKFSLTCSIFITLFVVGSIFSAAIFIFKTPLAIFITRSSGNSNLMLIMAFILFMNMFYGITMSLFNIMEESQKYILFTSGNNIFFILFLVLFVIFDNFTIKTIFISNLLSLSIFSTLALVSMYKQLTKYQTSGAKYYDFSIIAPMIKFGLIMIPGTLAMMMMRVADRYMITYFDVGGMNAVGIYAISYKIGMIVQFLVSMISIAYFPYVMKISNKDKQAKSFRKMFDYYLWGGGLLVILTILFTPEIFELLVKGDYAFAAKITFIGIISTYLHGMFNIINLTFYANQKAGNIALAVVGGALMNLALNYILIPKYSLLGAGISSIIAYLFIVFFNSYIAHKVFKVNFKVGYLLIVLALSAVFSYYNYFAEFKISVLFVKLVIVSIFFVAFGLYFEKIGVLSKLKELVVKK